MSSLGYSEFSNNGSETIKGASKNEDSGIAKKRNRTLKVRQPGAATHAAGPQIQEDTRPKQESGAGAGLLGVASSKIKQMKDYIENIHKNGGEVSSDDEEDTYSPDLPVYPGQGFGLGGIGHNVVKNEVYKAPMDAGSGPVEGFNSDAASNVGVKHTSQTVSLGPGSHYTSTLLDGFKGADTRHVPSASASTRTSASALNSTEGLSTYAKQYYEQFVPHMDAMTASLGNNGAVGAGSGALIEKLNYIIHMLEEKRDEKTGHVMEELVLYCFLGVFVIFVVDSFARAGKYVR
jgi:hypothetical protein